MAVLPPATLKRKSSLPVWVAIGWRVLAVLALLALAIGVHWIERDGLKDTADGHVSFLDIIYFTSISITTTGYGDIVPVSDSGADVRCAGGDADPRLRGAALPRHRL
jgi:voltage-gated potassium channel